MSHPDEEQQPLLQATVQPLPTVGEGCLTRFDPELLTEQQGADFSAAQQLCHYWLSQYNTEQTHDPSHLQAIKQRTKVTVRRT